jgi:hypothetical protein
MCILANIRRLVAVSLALQGIGAAASINIAIATTEVIRSDISRTTFGSGVQFDSSQLRWTVDTLDGVTPLTADVIAWLELGSFRFPHGTPGQHYISENPEWSYYECKRIDPNDPTKGCTQETKHWGNQWDRFLTPEEITRYTDGRFRMNRLFQVNTWMWAASPWNFRFVKKEGRLNAENLMIAADKASAWVKRDGGKTLHWEVGNEDWSQWSGPEYAEIFDVFQARMKDPRLNGNNAPRLLAQGLAKDFGASTVRGWYEALRNRLQHRTDSVYAYSIHHYMRAHPYPSVSSQLERRQRQTIDMLADVASGEPIANLKNILGTNTTTSPTRHWKIWVTEFNVDPPRGQKDSRGQPIPSVLQDMGHGLVIADWTGKMLEQNVERMFMHSLDNNPEYALVQYQNEGATINTPRVTVPGRAYAIYPQEFGKTMVRSLVSGNPMLTSPGGKQYPQIAAYSSIAADGRSLKVMVINRHLTEKATVAISIAAAPHQRRLANGNFGHKELFAPRITDSNRDDGGHVKWSTTRYGHQPAAGIQSLVLQPGSANLLTLPLQ